MEIRRIPLHKQEPLCDEKESRKHEIVVFFSQEMNSTDIIDERKFDFELFGAYMTLILVFVAIIIKYVIFA